MRTAWWIASVSMLAIGCGGDDGPGAGCPDFVRISGGTFARTPAQLTWTLEVVAIPPELTFDRASLPAFVQEYSWGIDVDANDDGSLDWEVAAKHYKLEMPERVVTDLLAVVQTDLWKVEGPVGVITGAADVTLAGTTFTFVVDASEDAGLADVTEASRFTWSTFHKYGPKLSDQCTDTFGD